MLLSWALGLGGLLTFLGFTGMAGGAGTFLTRWLVGKNEKIAREVEAEVKREAEEIINRELNDLQRQLEKDGDARTQELLHDLRTLFEAFCRDEKWQENIGPAIAIDIIAKVEDLFEHGIQMLNQTLGLHETARKLSRAEAKKQVMDQREKLIGRIGSTVEHLTKHLASVQVIGTDRAARQRDLDRIQDEIDITLKALRDVDNSVGGYSESELRKYEQH